jgi:hypothetical protein
MSKPALLELSGEIIKAHILDPDNSPLPEQYREKLNRAVSMFKLLDKHPVAKNAIRFHRVVYPEISLDTAYRDLKLARMVFSSYQDFDFDFWLAWTLSDITDNITKCRSTQLPADRKVIAQEHANLVRLLGKRPDTPIDPLRNEKHEFYIMVNIGKQSTKINLDSLSELPINTLQELNRALFSGHEIDEQGAADIMNS